MADLTSANVTVTLDASDIDYVGMGKVVTPIIAFGNGVLTYPANGVPLPAIGAFGMKQGIKRTFIEGMPGDGYVYKYDRTNHTIRIYQSAGFTPAGTIAAPTLTMDEYTPAGTNDGASPPVFTGTPATLTGDVSAPVFTGTARAAAALVELGNVAVPATTLYLMMMGF